MGTFRTRFVILDGGAGEFGCLDEGDIIIPVAFLISPRGPVILKLASQEASRVASFGEIPTPAGDCRSCTIRWRICELHAPPCATLAFQVFKLGSNVVKQGHSEGSTRNTSPGVLQTWQGFVVERARQPIATQKLVQSVLPANVSFPKFRQAVR